MKWVCVRCGSRPRWNDTYLCWECRIDPQQRREIAEAVERAGDRGARTYLVKELHWAGRWSTRG